VAGHVGQGDDRAAGDVDTVDGAFVEVPSNDGVAGAVVGILANPARAQHPAVANFEKSAFEMVSHVYPPALLSATGSTRRDAKRSLRYEMALSAKADQIEGCRAIRIRQRSHACHGVASS